ncbi:RidA family protein [Gordonia sp. CPCC 205333]|uniref:RidA family protein n=1 Tax=Gordonia sp. CPCC 205333 TaxID=3140790 RepID=UPI003AF3E4E5
MITPIHSAAAPEPFGPYSSGAQIGNFVQVSGQLGIDRRTGGLAGEGAYGQARQAIANIAAILGERDLGFDDVLMLRIFAESPEQFPEINRAIEEVLTPPYPARTTLFAGLPVGIAVEIDALAIIA